MILSEHFFFYILVSLKEIFCVEGVVNCRYDWHQTATTVTVAIYAKKIDPARSVVEINPVRLRVHLYFPLVSILAYRV